MKTKNLIFVIALSLTSISSMSQGLISKHIESLESVNTVVIVANGNVTINPIIENELKISSYLQSNGDIWGFKFPEKRPEFESVTRKSNDTLYVTTPKQFYYSTIGISTYSENVESLIQIPIHSEIIVKQGDKIICDDGFQYLEIENASSINLYNTNKEHFKALFCTVSKELKVNGIDKGASYEFQGNGTNTYFLNANNIELTFEN